MTGHWASGWPDMIRALLFPIFTSTNKRVTVTSFTQYHISLSQPVNQIKSCTCWLMMYKLKQIPPAYLNSTCWQECPSGRVTFKQGIRTAPTKKSGLQDYINLPPEPKSVRFQPMVPTTITEVAPYWYKTIRNVPKHSQYSPVHHHICFGDKNKMSTKMQSWKPLLLTGFNLHKRCKVCSKA